ncbi:hypothetical protein B0H16DRAFT_1746981 [Mycena metata]|uniref:Uncharacterized protein n=1 Tax=Mycena metata TaxID=1033252 RepID=A0AAD7GV25_9AGAR|nr:hypothetical protein B0H16DRAFT_1746981 [Mycena metata]
MNDGDTPAGANYTNNMPPEIWEQIINLAAPEAFDNAERVAFFRRAMTQSFSYLRTIAFCSTFIWSSIRIHIQLSPKWLAFALQFATAQIHLLLDLRDLGLPNGANDPRSVYLRLIKLLERVRATAPRWQSFHLITEHPAIYRMVQQFYADLDTPNLAKVELDYLDLEGYSEFDVPLRTEHRSSSQDARWFKDRFPAINTITASTVTMNWEQVLAWSTLTVLDLSHLTFGSITPLTALISTSDKLTELSLVDIAFTPTEDDTQVASKSLTRLRVGLTSSSEGTGLTHLMARLVLPNLDDITIIAKYSSAENPFRPLQHLLPGVGALTLRGSYNNDTTHLRELFSCITRAHTIDLTRFRGDAFRALHDDLFQRMVAIPPLTIPPLKRILLHRENIAEVISLAALFCPFSERTTSRIDYLQLDLPMFEIPPVALALLHLVREVKFTGMVPYNTMLGDHAQLSLPTAHSVFRTT